jgi:hypothetical protein
MIKHEKTHANAYVGSIQMCVGNLASLQIQARNTNSDIEPGLTLNTDRL